MPLPLWYFGIFLSSSVTQLFFCLSSGLALEAKHRVAHKPNSMPKADAVLDLRELDGKTGREGEDEGGQQSVMTEEELWARLDELEKLEALQDEQDR